MKQNSAFMRRAVIVACVFQFIQPTQVCAYDPYHVETNEYCPSNNDLKISWKDYILHRYPDTNGKKTALFGIQLRYAREMTDRSTLLGLDPAACYTSGYYLHMPGMKDGYASSPVYGYDHKPHQEGRQMRDGLPGDPSHGEVSVMGVIFKFNEAGEIFDSKGQKVGQMVCYLSNECEKYKF